MGKTRGPHVGCQDPIVSARRDPEGSPQTLHMSEAPSTLGERLRCAPFHSTYYYRSERKTYRSYRGWPR